MRASRIHGQAYLDALFGIGLFLAAFTFALWLFTHERRRLLCEKKVFEATRTALNRANDDENSRGPAWGEGSVRIRSDSVRVEGAFRCGDEEIRVALRRLDQWPD